MRRVGDTEVCSAEVTKASTHNRRLLPAQSGRGSPVPPALADWAARLQRFELRLASRRIFQAVAIWGKKRCLWSE